jgi:hypothetical protein
LCGVPQLGDGVLLSIVELPEDFFFLFSSSSFEFLIEVNSRISQLGSLFISSFNDPLHHSLSDSLIITF